MPVVSAPVVALPRHQVDTDELLSVLSELYVDHPRLKAIHTAIRATSVRSRWYTRPLAEQFSTDVPVVERMRTHLRDSLDLAESAARGALFESGLEPGDITNLVVTSATGHTMPGLDVHLMERLALPCSVRRLPVTQLGCGGGAFALTRARDLVLARPDATVLVVCADVYSHYLHPADTGMDGMIFKGLIGDAAGACVVRAGSDGPHMELNEPWEYLLPGSRDIVGSYVDSDGLHAHNAPRLLRAVQDIAPRVREWLERTAPPGADARPGFVVSHSGSPKILDAVMAGLGCPPEMVDLSRDSLRELGNVGSASVLDVLERTFAKPPADGDEGLLLALGPGISLIASKITWRA
ncbi:PhlD [Streptomyces sp. NPDC050439]|uniref:PhlD n=1 Tax=unclassified Streptomyces TaxID=2593676 RepID=UPI003427A0B0